MTGLSVSGLRVCFGDVVAVDDVTMDIPGEGCSGLIGPNGSGKTSFLNAVSGFVAASGSVHLDGRPIELGHPRRAAAAGLARTFQTPQTFANLSCLDNVLLGMGLQGAGSVIGAWVLRARMHTEERRRRGRAEELLGTVGLSGRAGTAAGELSYGEQRRLELARAMAARPRMILLDEPAAGLNADETAALATIIEAARGDGVGFFLVEHKLDFVTRLCARLSVLAQGRVIAEGAPAEVLTDRAVMDAYLGMRHRA